jgi:hypothetical protein
MSEYQKVFKDPKTFNILKKQSADSLKDMLRGKSFMQASMDSMRLLPQVIKAEAPYKDYLEEIAKEVLENVYPIVKQSGITIDAKIVGPSALKLSQDDSPTEEEVEEFTQKSGIDKRRLINAITQGASIRGTKAYYVFDDILNTLDDTLLDSYSTIIGNAYGIYDDDNAIAMMLAMMSQNGAAQGGESSVDWDEEEGTLVIRARALIFPILIHELVKGLYEILSLQGFSADVEQNKQIVSKVDKVTNEPEDLRYGKFIYDALSKYVIESPYNPAKIRELFFMEIYKLPDSKFHEFVENSINNKITPVEKNWVENTLKKLNDKNK